MRDILRFHRNDDRVPGQTVRQPRVIGREHSGAAALTLAFALVTSGLQMVTFVGTGPQAGSRASASSALDRSAGQAENQARWADLEAEGRATNGDYDGAVQAHQEAERDRLTAERLRESSLAR
jgi:hypothetical protein